MFIAEQKKRDNIAEYLLYMWQLEDILRAFELDIDKVQQRLIDTTNHSDEKKEAARQWYTKLIEQMKLEGVEKVGHLNQNKELLDDLNLVHSQLIKNANETEYIETYYKTLQYIHELKYIETYFKTLPFIQELRGKSKSQDLPEIEICFTALYGFLLLKLQKREVSPDTASAISQISNLLRSLSEKYN